MAHRELNITIHRRSDKCCADIATVPQGILVRQTLRSGEQTAYRFLNSVRVAKKTLRRLWFMHRSFEKQGRCKKEAQAGWHSRGNGLLLRRR